ncbi:MAG: HNH endonuclease [Bacteroidetes bacterium]|nr:HNH endonuclease [Bacteroidota bacterium]
MHFVDRSEIKNPPIEKLKELNDSHKPNWISYNKARSEKKTPLPIKPSSGWLHDQIRTPLKTLFLKNCGYCGTHTDLGNDAEVDHHFPTSLDIKAEYIYNWENYIWSCPSCNGMKKHHYPLLNPCLILDMKHIYFHSADGRYLYYKNTPNEIITKYENTQRYSNLNLKTNPDFRKYIFRDTTENHLKGLKMYWELYEVEAKVHGEASTEAKNKLDAFNLKKENFMDLIRSGYHLMLIKYAFDVFCDNQEFNFPFTIKELIEESKYLNT